MEFKNCSYCQRPYGTLGTNNKPIIRTFDHITPRKQIKTFKSSGRTGVRCRGVMSFAEADDLLECCNECNLIKGHMPLLQFRARLSIIAIQKRHIHPNHYLTDEVVKTIKESINTILHVKPEPILINIIE